MESRKSVKLEEKSLERKIRGISDEDCIGLKETCPFQDQGVIEVHCRTDCAWYSDDACIVWDLVGLLRRISGDLSCIQSQTERR